VLVKRGAPLVVVLVAMSGEEGRAAVMAEIIRRAVAAHRQGQEIRLTALKQRVCAELRYAGRVPKTVELLAALPARHAHLLPLLKAKPVRSASGIAVVAVMCKPHRCPHITMTGNICVYWSLSLSLSFFFFFFSFPQVFLKPIVIKKQQSWRSRQRL
jgi:hypothetical protein